MITPIKSIVLLSFFIGLADFSYGQAKNAKGGNNTTADNNAITALSYLKANNPDAARKEIDQIFATPQAKPGAKALLAKAQIYFAINGLEKYKEEHLYRDGTKALFKLTELKPDYERSVVDQLFLAGAFMFYNDGAKAYNDKKLAEAPDLMKWVVRIHDLNSGARFDHYPVAKQFDSVAADAYQIMASADYYTGKYDEAIPLLITVKNNLITRSPSAFENLIYAYNIQKNATQAYAVIQEARKAFPDDMTIRNYELDHLINTGRKEELLKKADAALINDPKNADMLFDEGIVYISMAAPVDGKKPENAGEMNGKAENVFLRALSISPDNASYNYTFATFYYNRASDINEKINTIKGNLDADIQRQQELKAKSDALLAKAMPYFEKAFSLYATTVLSLRDDDKKAYKSTMMALKEIYTSQNKKEKAADMKSKYDTAMP